MFSHMIRRQSDGVNGVNLEVLNQIEFQREKAGCSSHPAHFIAFLADTLHETAHTAMAAWLHLSWRPMADR